MTERGPLTERSRFQGVLQIWQYNRRFYLTTVAALPAACLAAWWLPSWLRPAVLLAVSAGVAWTAASLAVSHYIYDRSSLYDFSWMPARLGFAPASIASFHAGLDECSLLLQATFPNAREEVFDIFDRREMTEPSILRARLLAARNDSVQSADWRSLPAVDGRFDAAFLIFAAHELRRPDARVQLFRELARVTRPGGAVVLIEHLRDAANFLAFGPGFLHFFSRADWLKVAHVSGLRCEAEFAITRFVRVFVFRR